MPMLGHLADLGAGHLGRVVVQPQRPGRDDARPVDDALVDVIAQRDVAFRGSAAGQHRGVAGFEQRLHLRLFVGAGVDVAVGVDEAGHGGHAFGVDLFSGPACWPRPPPRRRFCRRAHDHRARIDHGSVPDDDADVGDRHILSRQ